MTSSSTLYVAGLMQCGTSGREHRSYDFKLLLYYIMKVTSYLRPLTSVGLRVLRSQRNCSLAHCFLEFHLLDDPDIIRRQPGPSRPPQGGGFSCKRGHWACLHLSLDTGCPEANSSVSHLGERQSLSWESSQDKECFVNQYSLSIWPKNYGFVFYFPSGWYRY